MKPWSKFLIVFAASFVTLASWAEGNPVDIGGTLARSTVVLLIPFLIAYAARGRRAKRDWNSFARWFFWLALIFAAGTFTAQHTR